MWYSPLDDKEKIDLAYNSYMAYGSVTEYKNFRGEPMPEFDKLPEVIQKAWIKASSYAYDMGINGDKIEKGFKETFNTSPHANNPPNTGKTI